MVPSRLIASSLGLIAAVLMPRQAAAKGDERCFDLAMPGLVEALASRQGQLLLIQVRNPSPGAKLAAATLAREAEKRGLGTASLAEPWPANGSEEQERAYAVRLSSEKNAQLVAFVEFLTGREPPAARVEIRDHDGRKLAGIIAWSTDTSNCPSDLPSVAGAGIAGSTQAPDATWYGGQLVLTDLGSLGLLVLLPPLGALVFAFVPPALHVENEQYLRAGLSLALRVGLPLTAAAVLIARTPRTGNEDIDPYLISGIEGFLVGGLMAAIIDDFLLAWKKPSAPAPVSGASSPHDTAKVQVGVTLTPSRQGAGLGLVGRF